MSSESDRPLSIFEGASQQIGKAKRVVWWDGLRDGFESETDTKRIETFYRMLEQVAPEWLEEAKGFAQDQLPAYLDFQCREPQPEPTLLKEANCSTLLVLQNKARDGKPLLLKIRDEAPRRQVMFRQQVGDTYAVLAGTNVENMGFAQMVNSAGLAGANNTGGPLLDKDLSVGLNDCHVLRLIAERCATCDEALGLVEELAAKKYLGGAGYARGMIFILADATGQGMIMECTRSEVVARSFTEGMHLRTNHFCFSEMEPYTDRTRFSDASMQSSFERFARMEKLAAENEMLSVHDLKRISRDQEGAYPLCQVQSAFPWETVSSWIHEVDRSSITTYACNRAPVLEEYEEIRME